jgi:DNA-binding GntR family transcriptional regulator
MKFHQKIGVPLYLQIKEHLLAKIDAGAWPEEAVIPAESELCAEYGVSKITVREAIKLLVHVARHLDIPEQEPVTRIERQRLGNNEPLMLEAAKGG